MTKLHVFDMDGTLLTGSACLEVSRHMGQSTAVDAIEERWGRGEVGHVEFYDLCIPLWVGLGEVDIDEVFAATPWLRGIPAVWADIAARGEHSAVVSLSPQFFVDRLCAWGLEFPFGAGVMAGEPVVPERVLTPAAKVEIVDGLLARLGLGRGDCVAYGDSASDLPLFRALTNTVSVNGTATLREFAARAWEGDDLRAAYAVGRALIDGDVGEPADVAPSRAGTR